MTPDEPIIVSTEVVQTAVGLERNGKEYWVRLWCGEHSILLSPGEADLFAGQIRHTARNARLFKPEQP